MWLQVGNLAAPVEEWTVGGTALTSLMDVERRHGIVTTNPNTGQLGQIHRVVICNAKVQSLKLYWVSGIIFQCLRVICIISIKITNIRVFPSDVH